MKKSILTTTLAVGILFSAISVKAEENFVEKFKCSNEQGQTLIVSHSVSAIKTKEAKIQFFTEPKVSKTYSAVIDVSIMPGVIYNSLFYQLISEGEKVGTLNVTTHKSVGRGGGFCGRALCPDDMTSSSTQALLKLGEDEIIFECE